MREGSKREAPGLQARPEGREPDPKGRAQTTAMTHPDKAMVERADAIDEALRKLHGEAFVAGVCYGRDEWPQDDEEWADLRRGIESEAVGEHYEGWSPETIAALTAIPNPQGWEALRAAAIELRDDLIMRGEMDDFGMVIVDASLGKWARFCDAIDALPPPPVQEKE